MLLKGVSTELFDDAIYPGALRLAGVREVYLVGAPFKSAETFFIDPVTEHQALAEHRAVVFDVSHGIRDVTTEAPPSNELATHVDLGSDSHQLGPTWYPSEGHYRWMPKHASVTLRGPHAPGENLYLKGFSPAAALREGPLALQISVDGQRLPSVWVRQPDSEFSLALALPADATGKATLLIDLELSRTFRTPPDQRQLGLAFTTIEIH